MTIKEVLKKHGNNPKLEITMDNDQTLFYIGDKKIAEANGYRDIEELYPLLFPNAQVEWC